MKEYGRRLQVAVGAGALLLLASVAQAATIVANPVPTTNGTTSWTTVQNPVSPFNAIDTGNPQDAIPNGSFVTLVLPSNTVTITFGGGSTGTLMDGGGNWAAGGNNLTSARILWTNDAQVPGSPVLDSITLHFTTPITAFVAEVQAFRVSGQGYTINATADGGNQLGVTDANGDSKTLGFTSGTPFQDVVLTGYNFGVGTASFFTGIPTTPEPGPTPEPGTMLMMGGGLLAVGYKLRNRFSM